MNIVVGYVMSPEGDAAIDAAVAEAKLRGGKLLVLHSSKGGHSESEEEVLAYREAGEKIEERLAADGVDFELHSYVLGNSPSEDIVRVAKETEAELIVIGIRHRSLVGKLVLGSNAQEILMDAPCAVLSVKAAAEQ
jgi:nucleotide-binding universal stress UspA family protein